MGSPNVSSAVTRPDVRDAVYREWDVNKVKQLYVADLALPRCDVPTASGSYKKISREEVLKRIETLRAPDGGYRRGSFKVTETTFDTEERGFEVPIDANKEKQLEGYFNARREAADIALAQVTQEHEIVVAGLMQSTATFPDTAIAGVKWGTKATATPTSDINVAKAAVLDACGMPANKVIMADATWEAFRVCDEVLDRIGSVSSGDPKKISRQVAASILDVDEVVVASARYNSAKEGQTGSLASIWDTDKVFVGYVAPAPRLDNLTVGMNLHWAGDGSEYEWRVEEYWSEEKRCWVIRVRRQAKPVIRAASCGYVLTTVLTKA